MPASTNSTNLGRAIDWSGYNLHDTSSLTSRVISLNIAFMALVTLFTGMRMCVRLCMIRNAGIDDYIMVTAAICSLVLSSFFLVGTTHGLGKHIWVLAQEEQANLLITISHLTQSLYGSYLSYATAISLTKCSIVVSYLRIFPSQYSMLRRLVIATCAVVIAMWLCSIFAIIFQCVPVQAAWDWNIRDGKCIDLISFFYVSSSINICTDLILWVVPLPYFWTMNMRTKERVMLCVLFSFAGFACIASMLRLSQLRSLHSDDITYSAVASANWSIAEVATAIVCASVPSLRPLGVLLLPKSWFATTTARDSQRRSIQTTASRTTNFKLNKYPPSREKFRSASTAAETLVGARKANGSAMDDETGNTDSWEELIFDCDTHSGSRQPEFVSEGDMDDMDGRRNGDGLSGSSPSSLPLEDVTHLNVRPSKEF